MQSTYNKIRAMGSNSAISAMDTKVGKIATEALKAITAGAMDMSRGKKPTESSGGTSSFSQKY